jgi:hypothetical protein
MLFVNKQYFTGLFLCVAFTSAALLFPNSAAAQTAEDQYRASLITLIAQLQEQITELQLQLASLTSEAVNMGILAEIEADVVASYSVYQGEISTRAPQAYRAYFDRLLTILPDQYEDHIDELVIFTGGNQEVGAYVETQVPYTKDWRYAVRVTEVTEDPESAASTELMVHEFVHIFSLDQVFQKGRLARDCHPYFADKVCYTADSYLGQFVEQFWSTSMLDRLQVVKNQGEAAQTDFYSRNKSQFVSEYAATDPAEDFAESFVWYVYGDRAPRGSIAATKIAYFDRFSSLRELAEEIQKER